MVTDKGTTNAEKSDIFYRLFRDESSRIDQKLSELQTSSSNTAQRKTITTQVQASIDRVTREIFNIQSSLPAHDLRTYNDAIKGWDKRLKQAQDALAPRKKFAFKAGGATAGVAASSARNEAPKAQTDRSDEATNEVADSSATSSLDASSTKMGAFNISGLKDQHLIVPSSPDDALSSGSITNITGSIVDRRLQTTPLASLTLREISSSLILCGSVTGPIHLTGIKNSIVVVSTRQFRMHDSMNCDVYLRAGSRPIIENCEEIRFAPLPRTLADGEAEESEQWKQVDDFNWHRAEASPNWRVIRDEERVGDEAWRDVLDTSTSKNVKEILEKLEIVEP